MSLGNLCHSGTNYLTEKYTGPTLSLGIVAGERIPRELSSANIPQRLVARERYPQRQVARNTPILSLRKMTNVIVHDIARINSGSQKGSALVGIPLQVGVHGYKVRRLNNIFA
nr:hypothetical protein [Tanacetum cinerariifolium]